MATCDMFKHAVREEVVSTYAGPKKFCSANDRWARGRRLQTQIIGCGSRSVADVEDHHVIALDRIVDAIRIARRGQDADFRVAADDANEWAAAETNGSGTQMPPHPVGCGRRALRSDVAANLTKVLESPRPPP